MNLYAINADVDPTAFLWLAGDDAVARADITSAERIGLLMMLDMTRKFGAWSGIWSKSKRGDGSFKANISVSAPISRFQWAP